MINTTTDSLALRVGRSLADFLVPAATDPSHYEGRGDPPPVVHANDFVGGRERFGPPVTALHRPGIAASVVVFGWGALLPFLLAVGDVWVFFPRRHSERFRVTLKNRVVWMRLAGAAVMWFAIVLGGMVLSAASFAASARVDPGGARASMALFALACAAVGWCLANWKLLHDVRAINAGMFRSTLLCEYGFPTRVTLFEGSSDGTQQEQLDCAARTLARCGGLAMAPWSRVDVRRRGTLHSVFAGVALPSIGSPRRWIGRAGAIAALLAVVAGSMTFFGTLASHGGSSFASPARLLRLYRRARSDAEQGSMGGLWGRRTRHQETQPTPQEDPEEGGTPEAPTGGMIPMAPFPAVAAPVAAPGFFRHARIGDRVNALWFGGTRYRGRVTAVDGDQVTVTFDDGDRRTGTVEELGIAR